MLNRSEFGRRFSGCLAAFIFCAVVPTVAVAKTIKEHEANLARDAGTEKPYEIERRSQFACAEIAADKNTGPVSHEIKLSSSVIERCELVKVGSRLHDCKKYRFKNPTITDAGIVNIDTKDGSLQFWLDQNARVTSTKETRIGAGGGNGTLTFVWPDKDEKYLCAAMR